jgi:hypothetical protein
MTPETYTGKPCAHGHTLRYRSNRKCVHCSRHEVVYIAQGIWTRYETEQDARAANGPGVTIWRATRVKSTVHS